VRSRGRTYFVKLRDVDWIEAAGNYVTLHTGERSHLVRGTMRRLEGLLDPARFVRVHRSAIVAIERVAHVEPTPSGDYRLTLTSGAVVASGETYRARVQALLDSPL
ncbi:MAG: LytTR family transcriptional regulator, partial [Gemmatimonadetes bacterium]